MSTERDELDAVYGRHNGTGEKIIFYSDARRIVDDLKRQLADVTKELEQERSCGAQVLHQEREAYNEMRAKLERVTRERDEARAKRDVVSAKLNVATKERDGLKRQLNWMHDANKLIKKTVDAGDTAIRQLESLCEVAESERDQAREQLSTVQAEAAAMRRAFEKRWSFGADYVGQPKAFVTFEYGDDAAKCYGAIENFIHGTAGRDLLDEMRRKDKRIAELDASLSKALDAMKEQEAEPEPAWQYRRHKNGVMWRTSDGVHVGFLVCGDWEKSSKYLNWQACCDDPSTYPCDEHGERIEEPEQSDDPPPARCKSCGVAWTDHAGPQNQCEQIQELRKQLAEQAPLVEAARELKELLKGASIYQQGGAVIVYPDKVGKVFDSLCKLRDAKGGA